MAPGIGPARMRSASASFRLYRKARPDISAVSLDRPDQMGHLNMSGSMGPQNSARSGTITDGALMRIFDGTRRLQNAG